MIKIPGMLMIGASGRRVGKTAFVCALIERFSAQRDIVGVKISAVDSFNQGHHPDVGRSEGAHVSSSCNSITEEKDSRGETDTSRMLVCGAKKVFWLQVWDSHLEEGLRALLDTLGDQTVSICESNRARRILEPGAFVMIKGPAESDWKPSAEQVASYADRIADSDGGKLDISVDDVELTGERWAVKMHATAIILAGGNGTRMGRDKTMLPVGGRPMIEHIYEQLRPHFSQILISSNDPSRHGFLGATVVPDRAGGQGPLMGIASALKVSAYERNFVIACDMPDVDTGFVRAMLRQVGDNDVVVPTEGPGLYEPLFAVYRQSALPTIEESLQSGRKRIVDSLSRCRVKYVDLAGRRLMNINTMNDYRQHVEGTTDADFRGSPEDRAGICEEA
jgi:molybdopterin-guanine dinucleotide biosynthesis protein A